jgi:methyltransferase (TIGR00027 family)
MKEVIMKPGKLSITARAVAFARAVESCAPAAERLFVDHLAYGFLGSTGQCVVRLCRIPTLTRLLDHVVPERAGAVGRTRYIDDVLASAIREGICQIVILGAGFDSRAYRVPGIEAARVFEVDYPATQVWKRHCLALLLNDVPAHVTFVPLDFNTEDLSGALSGAGYHSERPTLFIWEGVTEYLEASAVDAVFRYISRNSGPGSKVVFTYQDLRVINGSREVPGIQFRLRLLRWIGEPYTYGFAPQRLASYLASRGLELVQDVSGTEYARWYFQPRNRELRLGNFERVALAVVKGE